MNFFDIVQLLHYCFQTPFVIWVVLSEIEIQKVSIVMSKRVAIVEDEAAIRENYADLLRSQGYQVQTYANRSDATHAFNLRLPHLVILDIGLEEEYDGGFTLCQ